MATAAEMPEVCGHHMVKAVDILDSALNDKPTAHLLHKKEAASLV